MARRDDIGRRYALALVIRREMKLNLPRDSLRSQASARSRWYSWRNMAHIQQIRLPRIANQNEGMEGMTIVNDSRFLGNVGPTADLARAFQLCSRIELGICVES